MMSYYNFLPYSGEKQGRVAYSKMLTCHVKLTEPGGKRSPNKFTNGDAFSLPWAHQVWQTVTLLS